MLKSKSKYFDFLSPNIVSSLVLKGMGVVALAPSQWRDNEVYIYFPDGWIEKGRVIGNMGRTFLRIGSMYIGQRVLVRKI